MPSDLDTGQEPTEIPATEPVVEPTEPAVGGQTPVTEPPDADDAADEIPDEMQAQLERIRKEAAKYRTRMRTAEQERDALKAQLDAVQSQQRTPDPTQEAESRIALAERRALVAEAAAEMSIPASAIKAFRALESATDEAGVTAALDALKPFLATPGAGPQKPPADPGRTLNETEQIAEAEKAGDTKTAMRLKSARLAALAQKR